MVLTFFQVEEHHKTLASIVETIQAKRESVLNKWKDFKEATSTRRNKLENARELQEFLRNADEIEQWIDDKMKTATDESYKDSSNMQVQHPSSRASLLLQGENQEASNL